MWMPRYWTLKFPGTFANLILACLVLFFYMSVYLMCCIYNKVWVAKKHICKVYIQLALTVRKSLEGKRACLYGLRPAHRRSSQMPPSVSWGFPGLPKTLKQIWTNHPWVVGRDIMAAYLDWMWQWLIIARSYHPAFLHMPTQRGLLILTETALLPHIGTQAWGEAWPSRLVAMSLTLLNTPAPFQGWPGTSLGPGVYTSNCQWLGVASWP